MYWWLNPGNVLAQTIVPVMNVFTQSMHNLIGAIAILTPGNWFLTVFNMMGGFVRTVGAGVSDFWTLITPMQKRLQRLLRCFATSGM